MSRSYKKNAIIKDKEYGQKEFNRHFRRRKPMEDVVYKNNSKWSVRDYICWFSKYEMSEEEYKKVLRK